MTIQDKLRNGFRDTKCKDCIRNRICNRITSVYLCEYYTKHLETIIAEMIPYMQYQSHLANCDGVKCICGIDKYNHGLDDLKKRIGLCQ